MSGVSPGAEGSLAVYAINLDRRPDRWAQLSAALAAQGIAAERFPAIDAQAVGEGVLEAGFPRKGPLGLLGRGDMACTLSHFAAIERFLGTDREALLVLEDDALLAPDLGAILADRRWWPEGVHAVKLEAYLNRRVRVLVGPPVSETATGRALHPLLSRHVGAAAYLLDREGARRVLAARGVECVPIDHLLFNATVSRAARSLNILQMIPAPVRQMRARLGTDVANHRGAVRPKGLAYWRREAIRGLYEMRLIGAQARAVILGGARLRAVPFAPEPDPDDLPAPAHGT